MPSLSREHVGVALDMHGCPNRCRHCWLDHQVVATPRTCMSEDDVRWAVAQFRAFRRPGEDLRRQGIGRQLLREVMRLAKQRGVGEFHINTEQDNTAARCLYQSVGANVVGVQLEVELQ